MKSTEKKELSYFRLKLETYLNEHFPEMLGNNPFITARSDEALTAYCDAVAQGFSHPEAESMASEVLFRGLHFSKYDLTDDFEASPEYENLYTELTGTIALLIESNHLPTIGGENDTV